jgi:hypothetical protein
MPSQALLSISVYVIFYAIRPPPTRAYVQRSTLDSVQVYEDTAVM